MTGATLKRASAWGVLVSLIAIIGISCVPSSVAKPPSAPAETSEVNHFAGSVETLGEQQFPDTFAGAVLSPDGVVTVYAKAHDRGLKAAVAAINPKADPVNFVASKFSLNELDALTGELARHADRLQGNGVSLSEWSPDAPFDAVYVTLLRPSNKDLRRLSRSGLVPASLTVTRANYVAAASAAISTVVGPDYKVRPAFGDPIHAN